MPHLSYDRIPPCAYVSSFACVLPWMSPRLWRSSDEIRTGWSMIFRLCMFCGCCPCDFLGFRRFLRYAGFVLFIDGYLRRCYGLSYRFCIVDKFYVFCWFLYEYFNQINVPTRNIRIRILYVRLLIFWVNVENNVFTKSLIFIISLWIAFKKLLSDTKLWKRNLSWKYFSLSKYMIFL